MVYLMGGRPLSIKVRSTTTSPCSHTSSPPKPEQGAVESAARGSARRAPEVTPWQVLRPAGILGVGLGCGLGK